MDYSAQIPTHYFRMTISKYDSIWPTNVVALARVKENRQHKDLTFQYCRGSNIAGNSLYGRVDHVITIERYMRWPSDMTAFKCNRTNLLLRYCLQLWVWYRIQLVRGCRSVALKAGLGTSYIRWLFLQRFTRLQEPTATLSATDYLDS